MHKEAQNLFSKNGLGLSLTLLHSFQPNARDDNKRSESQCQGQRKKEEMHKMQFRFTYHAQKGPQK